MMRIGNSTRVEESQIRSFKWASDKDDHEAFLYANIINFKRSSNPRGHAHHCVMCGDRKAAIPSQNKDVCKTCDSGYWLVESVQVVVKFCKGCKNFTRLHDFRDKPEATKCIKCRQRGRQNYFAKKGRGDLATLPPPVKGGGSDLDHDHLMHHSGSSSRGMSNSQQTGQSYDYYMDDQSGMGPRVTSQRQQALQKNRMSKKGQGGQSNSKPKNGRGGHYNMGANQYLIDNTAMGDMSVFHRPHDHTRGESFSSLINGSYLPDDQNLLPLGDDDDDLSDSRDRSDTLLSITSVGLSGLGDSLGISTNKGSKRIGRNRVGSDDWDVGNSNLGNFGYLTSNIFDSEIPQFNVETKSSTAYGVSDRDSIPNNVVDPGSNSSYSSTVDSAAEVSAIARKAIAGKGKFIDEPDKFKDVKRDRSGSNTSETDIPLKRSKREPTAEE